MKNARFATPSIVLVFVLVGCSLSDTETELLTIALSNVDDIKAGPIFTPTEKMSIHFDSLSEKSDSSMRIWFGVGFDSIMILSKYGVTYWETANNVYTTRQVSLPLDTIDFRALSDAKYKFDIRLDSLKSETNYGVCPFIVYLDKGEEVRFSATIYTGCIVVRTD